MKRFIFLLLVLGFVIHLQNPTFYRGDSVRDIKVMEYQIPQSGYVVTGITYDGIKVTIPLSNVTSIEEKK